MDETDLREVLNETLENTRVIAVKFRAGVIYSSAAFIVKCAYILGLLCLRVNPLSHVDYWDFVAFCCVFLSIGLFKIHWIVGFVTWLYAFRWLSSYNEL
jgi:hypothetical protein